MYNVRLDIKSVEETITRPVINIVVSDIVALLGATNSARVIIGDNDTIDIEKTSSGIVSDRASPRPETVRVTYTERTVSETDNSFAIVSGAFNPIYEDPDIHTKATPILQKRKLLMTLTYNNISKSGLNTILNRLRLSALSGSRNEYHDIEYHYELPGTLINLLMEFNTKKGNYSTPMDFDEYLDSTCDDRLDVTNSHTGDLNKVIPVMREKQLGVLGTVLTDLHSLEKEYDEDTGYWSFELEYELEYEKPVQILVGYPLTIYNQIVDERHRPAAKRPRRGTGVRQPSGAIEELALQDKLAERVSRGKEYLTVPDEDNITLQPISSYLRLFSVYCIMSPDSLSDLFYIDEIPGIKFKPNILKLLELEAPYLGDTFNGLFTFLLYDHEDRVYENKIIVTPVTEILDGVSTLRLKLTTTTPLTMTGEYRVVCSMLTNISNMTSGRLSSLKANMEVVDNLMVSTVGETVIDSYLTVLDIDRSMLRPGYVVNENTTSMDIALNLKESIWSSFFTVQRSSILIGVLE